MKYQYPCCQNLTLSEQPPDVTKIADDFSGFLSLLEPDDEDVQLKPGQVKSVWIDPEFLKEIGEG